MGRWQLVAADRAGRELGEVRGALSRSVTPRPVKAHGSATLRLRTDHQLVPLFAEGETTRLKAYEDQPDGSRVLRFNGPVSSYEEVHGGEQDAVVIGFTAGGIQLEDRFVGKSRAGFTQGTALVPIDRGEIMARALDSANADNATQIIRGTIGTSAKSYVTALLWKPVLELWSELSGPLDGPDWEIEAIEPGSNAGAIGKLNTAGAIGSYRPDAVWEYGIGRSNVKSWRRVIDPKTVANQVWHLPLGYPDNTTDNAVSALDTASRDARGLHEALVAADITTLELRTQLVQEHVIVRRFPRQVIVFEPRMEVLGDMRYRVDYQEGDAFPFHAVQRYPVYDASGTYVIGQSTQDLVDAIFRTRAITFAIGDNGDATPVFTLTQEDA
jgi:hypothetical protein